jgi:hypothetical protein
MVLYSCVFIVFSLHRESLKVTLVDEPPPRGDSVTLFPSQASIGAHRPIRVFAL